jgi:hypothetical protein
MRTVLTAGLLMLACATAATTAAAAAQADTAPVISVSPERATAGFYRLAWEGPADARFEVQEADNEAFDEPRPVYTGHDTASVISGKSNGEFFYRVRVSGGEGPGPWSETTRVTVAHHGLSRALQFFLVGALVFAMLVVVIARGAPEDRDTA